MNKIIVDKPGLSKVQLLDKLKGFKDLYKDEINEHNLLLTQLDDGYLFDMKKKFLFLNFYVNGSIRVKDNLYVIEYDTNAPQGRVDEAINVIKSALQSA